MLVASVGVLSLLPSANATLQAPLPAVAVTGDVRAAADGTPVRGARIVVTARGGPVDVATSDALGHFEAVVPSNQRYALAVTKAGFAAVVQQGQVADGMPVRIGLERGAALSGRVVDDRGDPLLEAEVRLQRVGSTPDDIPGGFATTTDDDGQFRIGSLPAGRYEVVAESARWRALATTFYSADAKALKSVVIFTDDIDGAGSTIKINRMIQGPPRRAQLEMELRAGEERLLDLTVTAAETTTTAERVSSGPAGGRQPDVRDGASMRGRIWGPDGRPAGDADVRVIATAEQVSHVASTDANGQYEVTGLPPGSYTVHAEAAGALPAEYGQRQFGVTGVPVSVRADQRLADIDVTLARAGAITGMVVDRFGDPVENVAVGLWRLTSRGGRRSIEAVSNRRTDDRGRYRLFGVMPGIYYVSAADFDEPGESQFVTSPDGGQRVRLISHDEGGDEGPRVFHPGRSSLADAVPIIVGPGQEVGGIDIALAPTRGSRVFGTALDASGRPLAGIVRLIASYRSGAPVGPPMSAQPDRTGRFEFPNVPPGDYVLQAASGAQPPESTMSRIVILVDGASPITAFATERVTVSAGEDAGPVSLRAIAGSAVSGRVVVEGDRRDAAPQFSLRAVPADPDVTPGGREPTAAPDESGAFRFPTVHGLVRFVPSGLTGEWYLESVTIDGRDASRDPVRFGGADLSRSDVRAVLSSGAATVTGFVRDGTRQAVSYTAVAIATDPDLWFEGTSRVRLSRPDADGRFAITGLPPGDYWIAAVDAALDEGERAGWRNPDTLSALAAGARRMTLGTGQQERVELRLARAPF